MASQALTLQHTSICCLLLKQGLKYTGCPQSCSPVKTGLELLILLLVKCEGDGLVPPHLPLFLLAYMCCWEWRERGGGKEGGRKREWALLFCTPGWF